MSLPKGWLDVSQAAEKGRERTFLGLCGVFLSLIFRSETLMVCRVSSGYVWLLDGEKFVVKERERTFCFLGFFLGFGWLCFLLVG